MSETAKVRLYLEKYCVGCGVDIACGLEKIVPDAVGVDFQVQYNIADHPKTVADFIDGWEKFFEKQKPESFDYIYSSHLLEDYEKPFDVILRWLPYIKRRGFLIVALPIENKFKEHCEKTGQIYNNHHKQNWTGALDFCLSMPDHLWRRLMLIDFSSGREPIVDYNFFLVFKKC